MFGPIASPDIEEKTMSVYSLICIKVAAVVVGAAFALTPTATHAAQEEKVIISYSSRDFAFLPAHVAATKGFFRDEGFEPVMVQMRPPMAAPALINNEIQYTTTFGSILNAIMQGVPAKLLAVLTEKPPYYIVARPGIKAS